MPIESWKTAAVEFTELVGESRVGNKIVVNVLKFIWTASYDLFLSCFVFFW